MYPGLGYATYTNLGYYSLVSSPQALHDTDEMSVCMWLRTGTWAPFYQPIDFLQNDGLPTLLTIAVNIAETCFSCVWTHERAMVVGSHYNDGGYRDATSDSDYILLSSMHHYCVRMNLATGSRTVQFLRDGELYSEDTPSPDWVGPIIGSTPTQKIDATNCNIGACINAYESSSYGPGGDIEDLRIYRRMLTDDELRRICRTRGHDRVCRDMLYRAKGYGPAGGSANYRRRDNGGLNRTGELLTISGGVYANANLGFKPPRRRV